jgi:hypothetical protein
MPNADSLENTEQLNVAVPRELYKAAKHRIVEKDITLRALVTEALQKYLDSQAD